MEIRLANSSGGPLFCGCTFLYIPASAAFLRNLSKFLKLKYSFAAQVDRARIIHLHAASATWTRWPVSKNEMPLAAALIYWVIIFIWLTVLATLLIFYVRNPRVFGTTRLLLAVVAIDTIRNIVENIYFGVYFGGQYGLFPSQIVPVLANPYLLIVPKAL